MNGALYSALVCTRQMGILTLFCQAMGASAEVYFHIFNEIYLDHRLLFHILNEIYIDHRPPKGISVMWGYVILN